MKRYYVAKNKQQSGPHSLEEVISMMSTGSLTLTDYIFDEDLNDWVLLMAHSEVSQALEEQKPSKPPGPELESKVAVDETGLRPNIKNKNYRKKLIDEVREELGHKVDMSKVSDEHISGPFTASHFDDLIDNQEVTSKDLPTEIDDRTKEVVVDDIEELTKEIDISLEAVDATESKISQSLNKISKPIQKESLQFSSPKVETPMLNMSDNKKSIPQLQPTGAGFKSNKVSVKTNSFFKSSPAEASQSFYQGKVDKIKRGKGTLKEKAIKISKALEEVADPILSEWYVLKDHNKYGPYTYKDMLKMIDDKFICDYDYIWHSTLSFWRELNELDAFTPTNRMKFKDNFMPELTKAYSKRRHKRVNFGHSIMVHDNKNFWKGKSVQIGKGGVGVIMDKAHLTPGLTLYLHFKPGDGVPPFNATCEVVSKKPQLNEETQKLEVLYNMKFINISKDTGGLVQSITNSNKTG